MKEWEVKLPITGYALVVVEAETQDEAIQAAFGEVELKHIEEWEALEQVNAGNVCYAMHPWSAEAQCVSDDDQ